MSKINPELKEKIILSSLTSALTLVVTLVGLYIGQYISNKNSVEFYQLQRMSEMRERSYSKLFSLKVPWSQAAQTHLEAMILSDFYYTRFQVFSHTPEDLAEAKRQNDRGLDLIPTISNLQREVFESIAEIRISYNLTPELNNVLDTLYDFRTIALNKFDRRKIKSELDLEIIKDLASKQVADLCKSNFQGRIEGVLPHLLKQLRNK